MNAYETAFAGKDTRLIVSPVSDFFRFFRSPDGNQPGLPAKAPEASGPNSAAK